MIIYINTEKAPESYLKSFGLYDSDYQFAIQLFGDLIVQAKKQDNILQINKKVPYNA